MSVLVLSVLRCPDGAAPETRRVTGGEYAIGRGTENDWVLADPERVLSKRHCVVGFHGGAWHVTDTSTNGVFLNRDSDPVGRDQSQELREGDRLRLGAWEIEIRLEADTGMGMGSMDSFGAAPADHGAHRYAAPPRSTDAYSLDPFADHAPPPQRNPFDEPPQGGPGLPSAALPEDFDPLAPDPAPDYAGPTHEDHTPSFGDAFRPPPAHGPMAQGGAILGAGPIPDDFDPFAPEPVAQPPKAGPIPDDFGMAVPTGRPPPAPSPPTPQAFAAPPAMPTTPPIPQDDDWSDLAAPPAGGPAAKAAPSTATDDWLDFSSTAPAETPAPRPPPPTPIRTTTPPPPPPPPQAAARAAPAAAPADPSDLLAAFLRGAGLPDAQIGDPAQRMERLGAAFRALVAGLRRALIARASIKGEFRIEQTMIRSRGNNPLKFSAGDDDAVAALLGAGRRTEMDAPEAVTDALEDIRLHELASMAAMQSAIRALVDTLAPAPLLASAKGGLLPGQKQASAFEAYEALHAQVTAALTDDFDSVFGKAFARAYEQALTEAKSRPRD